MEPTVIVHALFCGFAFLRSTCTADQNRMTTDVSFPFDASDTKWAHAVNSRELLERELAGPADFIEADISLGFLNGNKFGTWIPIMAHPPNTSSNLSFEMFLDIVSTRNTGKGVKLDFKSLAVVEPSLIILRQRVEKLNFSLWLNADILSGPIHASTVPVKDDLFLLLCHQYFPKAVLSVGWTTEWYPTYSPDVWYYEWRHVRKMADIIRCFGYENKYPTFTFPVRGIFASRSIRQLQWLLGVVPGSSLTIWSAKNDPLELKDLMRIRSSFPMNKVYYDVPEPIRTLFMNAKNLTSYIDTSVSLIDGGKWVTLTHGQGPQCSSYTYISNNTIVFGKALTTAVLLKKLISVNDDNRVRAMGRIRFFEDYGEDENYVPESSQLTIVIVDVSLFYKNFSSGSLDNSVSDTEVLWKAMNESKLHSFNLDVDNECRMFKLDTYGDRSFQAWTVPCDEMSDERSFEEIAQRGVPEVSLRKRLVLPTGPFMIGFMSSGDEHVVIHDFKINVKKGKTSSNSSPIVEVTLGFFSILFVYFALRRLITS